MRLEAAVVYDILYLLGQGNFIFIRGKSGNFVATMNFNNPVKTALFFSRTVSL